MSGEASICSCLGRRDGVSIDSNVVMMPRSLHPVTGGQMLDAAAGIG
jgi:hypothetical protein